jgi:hypothetical protein
MKTKIIGFLSTLLCVALLTPGNAQSFDGEGDRLLNLGVGLGNGLAFNANTGFGGYSRSYSLPSIGASMDFGVHPDISVGPYVGFNVNGYRQVRTYNNFGQPLYERRNSTAIWFGAQGKYYFDNLIGLTDEFDLYAGVALGVSIVTDRYSYDDGISNTAPWRKGTETRGGVYPGLSVGGRYFFNDSIAVYSELGFVGAWWNIGVTFGL